uniref:Uncharacterized protein n=1 Tax=Anguilla anguilla TaxID=7936 RepID=A0A0E9W243_ANGAN
MSAIPTATKARKTFVHHIRCVEAGNSWTLLK